MKLLVIAAILGCAYAACPNDCTGHGVCGLSTQCECYRNWFGADCSNRICTFGRAFVDSPVGDLNGDGDLNPSRSFDPSTNFWVEGIDFVMGGTSELYDWQYGYARSSDTTQWDEAHFYRECSNKGLCNRETGQCDCFPGYEGEGCSRTACANDCSGHGVCRRLIDGDSTYSAWDAEKTQTCDCDAGYGGPDCSLRSCPRGADPVEYAQVVTNSIQGIYWANLDSTADDDVAPDNVYYTVTYTDEFGDEWTTSLLSIEYDDGGAGDGSASVQFGTHSLEDQVEALNNSLLALPNGFSSTYVWGLDSGTRYPLDDASTSPYTDSLDFRLDDQIEDAGCDGSLYGACFYVKFNTPGKQAALQVRYFFSPVDATNNKNYATRSGGNSDFVNGDTFAADLDHLVTVHDVQGDRVWNDNDGDVEYAFIDTLISDLDVCAKRGTCDYDTGLCNCFSGYSGLRCDDQNAIAYSY